jgi:hypothetical protein
MVCGFIIGLPLPFSFIPSAMPTSRTADPQPTPPTEPALEDCCQSGCDPCIFDIYQDALERYRVALQEWQARQSSQRPKPTTKHSRKQ